MYKILKYPNIVHGVTDVSLGSINPFANFDSEEKLIKFAKNQGYANLTKNDLIFADQVHGAESHICSAGDGGSIKLGVDGLVTNHPGQMLVIKTADCVPILIFDPVKKIVAAIHGGRKSITQGIIPKTIAKMAKHYGTNPKNLKIAIGPHIRKCHYWLKPDTLKSLEKTEWQKYFVRKEKVYFDLTQAVLDELDKAGVLVENIEDCGICTYCQYQKYYSARKKEENPDIYKEKLPCFASIIAIRR